jgi:glyoxylase-like metal-dependent hydrolase (beta-lactamase superfamily II)
VETVGVGIVLANCLRPSGYTASVSITIVKGESLAVVDTGEAPGASIALEAGLAELGASLGEVTLILNTHGHADHVGGNDTILAAGRAQVWYPHGEPRLLGMRVDREVRDGDVVELGGGRTLVAIATPGHTAGSIAWYLPTERMLIAGDAVQGPGSGPHRRLPAYFESGIAYRASLARLLDLDVTAMTIGHPLDWSGPRRGLHRGDDARRFLRESLESSYAIADAVAYAHADGDTTVESMRRGVVRHLRCHALFREFDGAAGLDERSDGTLEAERRDQGLS